MNSPTRLFDLLDYQLTNYPQEVALSNKVNGEWVTYSTKNVIDIVNALSIGLIKLGVNASSKVAIISPNRPEWNFIDLAVQQIGAVSVPMYPTITIEDYKFIFEDAGVEMAFVADQDLYSKASEASKEISGFKGIYTFDKLENVPQWTEVKEKGEGEDVGQLQPLKDAVKEDDLLTLIYTSGTTGRPKGVMLTHKNVLSNTKAVVEIVTETIDPPNSKALSFLPMCHIFERMAVYVYLYSGVSIYYAESIDTIGANLVEVKPEMMTTVPRLLEKIYDKIVSKGYELTGLKKKLFFWAIDLGLKYDPNVDQGAWYNFQLGIANKIIFNKWRDALGGNIKIVSSGAAALQQRLARIFWAAGIPISEGYGLTETSPVLTSSRVNDMRIGTVGFTVGNVEIKIAEDGEILAKGDNIMKGYYNRQDLTDEVIDQDGWFHTGDIGELVENKYLKITDRKKEMFKTSGGKYIAPQVMENKFKESMLIEQMMVVGNGQKFPAALIVPNIDGLKDWCSGQDIKYTTDAEMIELPEVLAKFEEEVAAKNEHFAKWEKIKKFKVVSEPWGVETGELTPTLKLKRRVISANYEKEINDFYGEQI